MARLPSRAMTKSALVLDAEAVSASREPHAAAGSPRVTRESAKMAVDATCRAATIAVEWFAITVTAAKWKSRLVSA